MKKTFLAIAISTASMMAAASGYCDGKPTHAERENCYRVANSTGNANPLVGMKLGMAQEVFDMNKRTVQGTPKLSSDERAKLLAQFDKFEAAKGGTCKGDMECLTKRVIAFNDSIKAQYVTFTKN